MAYELQTSFAAGEISPLMHLRADREYAALNDEALSLMENMLPDPHGPAASRLGSAFLVEIPNATFGRLFSLHISFAETYIICITDTFIYVLNRNGFQTTGNHITNGDFEDAGTGWTSNNITFSGGTAIMTTGGGGDKSAWLYQSIVLPSPLLSHTLTIRCVNGNLLEPYTIRIGTTIHGTEILEEVASGPSHSIDFVPGVSPVYVELYIPEGALEKTVDIVLLIDAATGVPLTFVSPWTNAEIKDLQADIEPGSPSLLFFSKTSQPKELVYTSAYVWTFQSIIFTAPPASWALNPPGSIAFHDGRMVVGGTNDLPLGIWLSKPSLHRNFTLGSLDDDAMYLPLDKHGSIQWLKSNDYLYAGLDTGEHIIFGTNGPLTPSNAETKQQSEYGSSRVQAAIVDEDIIYVGTRGRKVKKMKYADAQKSIASSDLSFIAEQITHGLVLEMHTGVYPNGILFCTMADGHMITCSMEKDRGTYGWSHHDIGAPILSAAVAKEFGLDIPVFSVLRNDKLYIEHMSFNEPTYVDSGLQLSNPVATNTWYGFDHLIGETVQVLADGAVHADVVVQAAGEIVLSKDVNSVIAGLQFIPTMRSLPKFENTDEGNTRNHIKRYSKVSISLVNSPRPIVNGQDTYKRDPSTTMGVREEDKTEIVEITNTGWSDDAIIEVSQPLPLNMVVSAIGGKLKSNKL